MFRLSEQKPSTQITHTETPISTLIDLAPRNKLMEARAAIAERFWADEPIETLIADLSKSIDGVVCDLFNETLSAAEGIALYAVGGYGRGELHPGSDIDLLIVAASPKKYQAEIERFLQLVFDLNLEVGHAVRDVKACKAEAKADITVATAMFERRFLIGDKKLDAKLDKTMASRRIWPVAKFFRAKYDEQIARHAHYDNVEYNLEPNVKTSPGGLRDIHTTLWICKRQFGTTDPDELVELAVITAQERDWLVEGRRFIWWVRFGLHLIAERKEDQLQFSHQRDLAERLGFVDTDAQRGVERFMHHYYRHVLALTEVNDILIQYFQENIVSRSRQKKQALNERFEIVDSYIEARDDELFTKTPSAILEAFVIMANRRDIAGVRARTIRLIRDALHLIDDDYRADPEHTKLFIDLLKAPYTLVSQLTRMRRYGILGRYIPEYGRVVGQMQHDLFHIYTVDAHTMMVIRNMRRFRYRSSEEAFPVAFHCVHTIPKVELLYIAGLYHDIGKGRGGDHSTLGAEDAREFCQRHNLTTADTDLVCWLVEQHLYMSTVSQREDIYDPDVVQDFAREVKSEMRLDYLYALTVADINATNPTLWNSWRATLLRQLYNETRRALRRGLESTADKQETIAAYKERALERLVAENAAEANEIEALWSQMGQDYFLRHSPRQIAKLTQTLLAYPNNDLPFVSVQDTRADLPGEGATQIYIYSQDLPQLFARTVVALTNLDLDVVDATVFTGEADGEEAMCFDTYTVLTNDGNPLPRDAELRAQLVQNVKASIAAPDDAEFKTTKRRLSRQLRELPRATEVDLKKTGDGETTTIVIIANDRPGLLALIAGIFVELDLHLRSARIATLGEMVEDTFLVQTAGGEPIPAGEASYTIQETLRQRIDAALKT